MVVGGRGGGVVVGTGNGGDDVGVSDVMDGVVSVGGSNVGAFVGGWVVLVLVMI